MQLTMSWYLLNGTEGLLYSPVHFCILTFSMIKRIDRYIDRMIEQILFELTVTQVLPPFSQMPAFFLWSRWSNTWIRPTTLLLSEDASALPSLMEVRAQVSTKDRSAALGLRTTGSNSTNGDTKDREMRKWHPSHLHDRVEQHEKVELRDSPLEPLNKNILSPNHEHLLHTGTVVNTGMAKNPVLIN